MTGPAIGVVAGFLAIGGGYAALVRAPDGSSADLGCMAMLAGLAVVVVSLSLMVLK